MPTSASAKLNFAIDRNAIARLFGGPDTTTPTCQIVPTTIPGHNPYCPYTRAPSRAGRWVSPDLARARQLVAASGTRGNAVGVLTEPGLASDEPTARYIVRLLRQLGYRARLRALPPKQRDAAVTDYRHPAQIVTEGWIADFPVGLAVDHPAAELRRMEPARTAEQPSRVLRPDRRSVGLRGQVAIAMQTPFRQPFVGASLDERITNLALNTHRNPVREQTCSPGASATTNTSQPSARCSTNSGYGKQGCSGHHRHRRCPRPTTSTSTQYIMDELGDNDPRRNRCRLRASRAIVAGAAELAGARC